MAQTAIATTTTSKSEYIDKLWMHLKNRITTVTTDDLSFEALTKFMSDARNIRLTRSFYGMLSSFCLKQPVQRHSINGGSDSTASAEDVKQARLILSSLMIFKFPTDVLDASDVTDLDPMSEACYTSAQQLIECILQYDSTSSPTKLQCDELYQRIHRFIDNFTVWKSNDAAKVLQSLRGYYAEWMRSYQVMSQSSSMNEAQKKSILNVLVTNMNNTQNKIGKLCGMDRAKVICQEIKEAVENSETAAAAALATATQQENKQQDLPGEEEEEEKHEEETVEQRLAKKGVPMHMQSGRAQLGSNRNQRSSDASKQQQPQEEKESPESKYIEMVNGQKMLNLDAIVMEEASKKYWSDFEQQIVLKNYSRLFQILSEILQRLKTLSPEKQHQHLDDLLDVNFLSQTIENGNINANAFYGIFYGIWSQIKSLHAPQEDSEWQKWHDHIMQQFGSDNATWATLLREVFNVFLRKMDRIEDQIKVIQHIKEEKKK